MSQVLTERITLTCSKITGGGDADRLEDRLSTLEGVRNVNVDTTAHTVETVFDPTVISALALEGELEKLGYKIDSKSEEAPLPL